jgi:carbon storage regulator
MLYLTRRPGEAVIVNNEIEVRVIEVRGRSVKLGFRFPPTATVLREEIYRRIEAENAASVRAARELCRAALRSDPGSAAQGGEERVEEA